MAEQIFLEMVRDSMGHVVNIQQIAGEVRKAAHGRSYIQLIDGKRVAELPAKDVCSIKLERTA